MQKAISKYWPVFVLPTLLAFIIGFIWPFIWGIYLSFQRFTTVSKTTFVGIQNYINVFQDSTFLHAFGFTAAFTVVSTVLINVCAFAIALVLTRGIRGTNIFHSSEGMVEKHQSTLVLPSATYWFAMVIRGLVESLAFLKGMTKPILSAIANQYVADGKTSVDWCFSTMPSEEWKNGVGSALTAYAAGTGDWNGVVTAFVDGWAKEYKLANG